MRVAHDWCLHLTPVPAHDCYELTQPYGFKVFDDNEELIYDLEVPPGFSYDGASIPKRVTSILGMTPFEPRLMFAALLHDYLYRTTDHGVHKNVADLIFKVMLKEHGLVSPTQVTACYECVHRFGWRYWKGERT